MKIWIVFLVALLFIISCSSDEGITSDECAEKGGRIVNTMGESCTENELEIGPVQNMECPCVCCVPK